VMCILELLCIVCEMCYVNSADVYGCRHDAGMFFMSTLKYTNLLLVGSIQFVLLLYH
jgi:hypothetical protein